MAQGGAKRIKGQLASAESAPVVLSTEQDVYLSETAAQTTITGDKLSAAIKTQGSAVSGMEAILLGAEDSGTGNIDALKSSSGELFIRSSSQLPVSDGGLSLTVDDGGTSLTVDGTVGLSAGTNNIGDVDVLTVPAPLSTTGGGTEATALRVTIANDSTGVVSIDDNGGSITVDGTVGVSGTVTVGAHAVTNAGTFAVQVDGAALTALQLIDDAVYTDGSGTVTKGVAILGQDGTNPQAIKTDSNGELQVDVLTMPNITIGAAIPAGTNNIGDVDVLSIAAGTNYIGKIRPTDGTTDAEIVPLAGYNAQAVAIVDGSGNQITSFGGGTQYTEDAAAASDPVGTVPILIRKDTPATVTGTDGDNVAQRATNYGAAYVQVVTSAGAFVDSFGGAAAGVTYGTDTNMTVTALNSLANSATAGWQSIRVSNVSTRAKDYIIGVKLTMANTAPANDKAAYVYICPFWTSDAGTTWYAASQGTTTLPTGAEGTTTIASPNNLRLLGVLNYTTQNMVLQDTFRLSDVFGTTMPQGFSIIVINYTGAAIAASTNLVSYTAIT